MVPAVHHTVLHAICRRSDRTCWPLVVVQATLKASDTDAVKISKELWGKMNPSYDSSATRMMSAAQESVSSLHSRWITAARPLRLLYLQLLPTALDVGVSFVRWKWFTTQPTWTAFTPSRRASATTGGKTISLTTWRRMRATLR